MKSYTVYRRNKLNLYVISLNALTNVVQLERLQPFTLIFIVVAWRDFLPCLSISRKVIDRLTTLKTGNYTPLTSNP